MIKKTNLCLVTMLVVTFFLIPNTIFGKNSIGKHAEFLYDAIATPDYGFILVVGSIFGKKSEDNKDQKDTLFYLSSKNLQKVRVKGEHTIPIGSNPFPKDIYLIEIKTNTQIGSVKVIKK